MNGERQTTATSVVHHTTPCLPLTHPSKTPSNHNNSHSSIIEQYPELRPSILGKLLQSFPLVHGSTVLGVAVWILGEYAALEPTLLSKAFDELVNAAGSPPFLPREEPSATAAAAAAAAAPAQQVVTKSVVLSDGTYATQAVLVPAGGADKAGAGGEDGKAVAPLRRCVSGGLLARCVCLFVCLIYKPSHLYTHNTNRALAAGDVFLGGVLVSSLTKLTVRALENGGSDAAAAKGMQARTLLVACGVGRMAEAKARGNVGAYAVRFRQRSGFVGGGGVFWGWMGVCVAKV